MASTIVLVAGASGKLGGLIARALLKRGVSVRILARSTDKPEVAALTAAGATVIKGELGVSSKPDDFVAAVTGAHAVVSAVSGGEDVIVHGQKALLQAAIAAGSVTKFIPSMFSYDYLRVPAGMNPNTDLRNTFEAWAEGAVARTNVQLHSVMNGMFLSRDVLFGFMGLVSLEKREVYVWGGEPVLHVPLHACTWEDTAEYTAAALTAATPLPRYIRVGVNFTLADLLRVFATTAGSGGPLAVVHKGSLEDLARTKKELMTSGAHFYAWLPLAYTEPMLSGLTSLRDSDLNNAAFPDVKPQTLADVVAKLA